MLKGIATAAAVFAAFAGLSAAAETTQAGASVKIDGAKGPVFAAGANVDIAGEIKSGPGPGIGVFAAGAHVNIPAKVDGALFLAGGDVSFSGRSHKLFAAGGHVTISGTVEDDAAIAGGDIAIAEGAAFDGDLNAAGGSVDFSGTARGDADLAGAYVRLNGVVEGDADLAGEAVDIGPNTHVKGDLSITSPKEVNIPSEARIDGEVTYKKESVHEFRRGHEPWRGPFGGRAGAVQSAFGALFWFVALGASGSLMALVFPGWFAMTATAGRDQALTTFLIGVCVLIVAPIAAILLMAIVLGLPFGGFLLALYFSLLSIAMIGAGFCVGHLLLDRSGEARARIGLFLAGLAILLVLGAIPLLGPIVKVFAFAFGLGALSRGLWAALRSASAA